MSSRIVITGLGTISPLGLDVPSFWEALLQGKSGVDRITLFDTEAFDTKIAAEVKGFDPMDYIERKQARHMDRYSQFAVVASRQAVEQAREQLPRRESGIALFNLFMPNPGRPSYQTCKEIWSFYD